MKKILLLITTASTLLLGACATQGGMQGQSTGVTSYDNTPDNPMVNSRAASSEEFTQENQF